MPYSITTIFPVQKRGNGNEFRENNEFFGRLDSLFIAASLPSLRASLTFVSTFVADKFSICGTPSIGIHQPHHKMLRKTGFNRKQCRIENRNRPFLKKNACFQGFGAYKGNIPSHPFCGRGINKDDFPSLPRIKKAPSKRAL
jgi:hypothetical protein